MCWPAMSTDSIYTFSRGGSSVSDSVIRWILSAIKILITLHLISRDSRVLLESLVSNLAVMSIGLTPISGNSEDRPNMTLVVK